MAKDIRDARAVGSAPTFTIETEQTRLLIDLMKSRQVPLQHWENVVSPLAYHYFPGTDSVGVQYPPGTGFMLSLFPEGRALHYLDRSVAVFFALTGLVLIAVAAVSRAWFAAGFSTLSLIVGLDILANIDIASFSINAMLTPLLLCALSISAAYALRHRGGRTVYLVWLLTCLSGLFFGFAFLVRLPLLFLLPGLFLILVPTQIRLWHRSALMPFALGFLAAGILPLMFYQLRMTGSWFSSTYPRYDSVPPSLEFFWPNLSFYFGPGKTRPFNWALPVAAIGLVGLMIRGRKPPIVDATPSPFPHLSRIRILLAVVITWLVPTAYFLTHTPTNHYYPLPATFGAVLVAGLAAFVLDDPSIGKVLSGAGRRKALLIVPFVLALVPGFAAIQHAWAHRNPPTTVAVAPRFEMPPELADERAWLWADFLSGTIWYYAQKPAYKIGATNDETRKLIFEFVRGRGEPQYIFGGDPGVASVFEQIPRLGGRLELRGQVDGYPYYLIHWSDDLAGMK
jgi:hypothetical protein